MLRAIVIWSKTAGADPVAHGGYRQPLAKPCNRPYRSYRRPGAGVYSGRPVLQAEEVVPQYRAEKQANLNNHAFSAKVGKYIDLDAMDTWFTDTAAGHFHNSNNATRRCSPTWRYLKRSASGTWFVDYDDLDAPMAD